jgi:hypothetical protein
MSTTTQEKFTNAMKRIADARRLDLVVDKAYSNVGAYAFQRRDSFDPILAFPFTFQEARGQFCSSSGISNGDPGPLGPRSEDDQRGFYGIEGKDYDLVVLRVEEVLDGSGALAPEPLISLAFSREDVDAMADELGIDRDLAWARAQAWRKTIEERAVERINESLYDAVADDTPSQGES